jgi:hypothetical protein
MSLSILRLVPAFVVLRISGYLSVHDRAGNDASPLESHLWYMWSVLYTKFVAGDILRNGAPAPSTD